GLYIKGHFGEHAFGFNISDIPTGGGFVSTPVTVTANGTAVNITGAMTVPGLDVRQAAFSYAYAFADKTFSIGFTAKVVQGAAYNGTKNLQGGQDSKLSDSFGKTQR